MDKADTASENGDGRSALYELVEDEAVEAVQRSLADDPGAVARLESIALNTSSLDIARLLVERGATRHPLTYSGRQPLDLFDMKCKPALGVWLQSLEE